MGILTLTGPPSPSEATPGTVGRSRRPDVPVHRGGDDLGLPDATEFRFAPFGSNPVREHLTRAGAIKALFAVFDAWLKGEVYLAMSGQIIDASIIAASRQRNTDAEKADLKEGRVPKA